MSCQLCARSERDFKSSREVTSKEDVRTDMAYFLTDGQS